ncbi:MAG TPA: ATP-dependent zinc metalloprotease FtsH [Mycobacteriales bacterium]|nr:ATP-dependent zinc metalloprotease FtsH [Mycobacteriales bacterium]
MNFKRMSRGPILWIVVLVILVFSLSSVLANASGYTSVDLSVIEHQIAVGNVASAIVDDKNQAIEVVVKSASAATKNATKLTSSYTQHYDAALVSELDSHGVATDIKVSHPNQLISLIFSLLPFVFILLIMLFFLNQMQGGGGRVMQFGKAKAKLVSKDTPKTTFADVAGVDEAIEELQEIKEFLENPAKFQAIGAKIPKGVLLYGPPGTGKTLLARAVAGEAGVPFYSISGSDFVEMFVGVGASRVRDLFEQAKANAPAIIFVDEIDAVGRHRGAGLGGGHDEREQTLNQLLVEMDGFDVKGGVILIAATNRPDILDPALLRPGRFDRQIVVDRPDLEGRKAILRVHAKGKPAAPEVDLDVIARRTPGFTGADLANVINEAALLTARSNARQITTAMLEESIDRVLAGPTRKSRVMSDKEKKVTAYHEGGHALVAFALPNMDPVHKLTILPRGRALGYTMVLPTEDKYTLTRSEMMDTLAYALGGRAAEELVFHEPTTGAANDIEKATATARAMVTQYGMSDRLGARKFGQENGEVFLGRDMGHQRDYSEDVAAQIDDEVRALIEQGHDEAWDILVEYRDVLDNLVLRLLDKETLNKDDLAEVFASVTKRPSRVFASPRRRPAKDVPPVLTPNELALLGPKDVAGLGRARTPRSGNGSASNGGNGAGNGTRDGSGRSGRAGGRRATAAEPPGSRRSTGGAERTADVPRAKKGRPAAKEKGRTPRRRPEPGATG